MSAPKLSEQPSIDPTAVVLNSTLGRWTEVAEQTRVQDCEIGDYSYVMERCDLQHARLGKFCNVAKHARINPSNHPMWRPTLHHFTYRAAKYGLGEDDPEVFAWRKSDSVTVGHDVWIGHGAIILPGVTIGTGAVIGAGAIVSKDVPDYAIVVGVPARVIRFRFPPTVQKALRRIAWWDWSHEQLAEALPDFRGNDVLAFVKKYDRAKSTATLRAA